VPNRDLLLEVFRQSLLPQLLKPSNRFASIVQAALADDRLTLDNRETLAVGGGRYNGGALFGCVFWVRI